MEKGSGKEDQAGKAGKRSGDLACEVEIRGEWEGERRVR